MEYPGKEIVPIWDLGTCKGRILATEPSRWALLYSFKVCCRGVRKEPQGVGVDLSLDPALQQVVLPHFRKEGMDRLVVAKTPVEIPVSIIKGPGLVPDSGSASSFLQK